jgi:putative FmdB family regulatory protein
MLYEYKCESCGELETVKLGMTEPKEPKTCPCCGGVSRRVFTPVQDIWKDSFGRTVRSPGKQWVGGDKFDPVRFKAENPSYKGKVKQ